MQSHISRTISAALLVLIFVLTSAAQDKTSSKFSPALAEREDVKRALAYIDSNFDNQVAEWMKLTAIPALSTHEQKRAAYITSELEKAGLKPTVDSMGNVSARRPGIGGGPTILVAAHMDTVHPMDTDLTIKRLPDGTVHTPGVFDDTPADVNLLQSLRALNAANVKTRGDLILLFTVQEELGLKGMSFWFEHNPNAASMIVAVDSSLGSVNYGALGIYWSKMKFTAAGAHTLDSKGQPHPARAAAQCISDIYSVPLPSEDKTAIYNVGMLGGGTVVNAIAPEAWFTVDLRTVDAANLKQLDSAIVGKCEAAARAQGVRFEREFVQRLEAGGRADQLVDRLNHAVVQTPIAVLQYLDITPSVTATGATDANVGVIHGVPSVAIGRTNGGNQHSLSEWADVESARIGTKQLLLVEVSLAELQ